MSLFNVSNFFIYLAIFIVFIFLSGVSVYLYVYSRQQFEQQNHKINTMVSLINMFTQQQQQQQDESSANQNTFGQLYNNLAFTSNDLITVSDDNIEELEDEDEDEDADAEVLEEEDSEEEFDGDDIEGEGEDLEEELEDLEEEEENELKNENNNNIKSVNLVNIEEEKPEEDVPTYTLNLIDMEEENQETKINSEETKPKKSIQIFDYKKLSLVDLKKLIVEKGVVSDASKMKKMDILKLLGDETNE